MEICIMLKFKFLKTINFENPELLIFLILNFKQKFAPKKSLLERVTQTTQLKA